MTTLKFFPREKRKSLGLNQSEFWNPLGVTYASGSRYETMRTIPKPVQILLTIAYGTQKQAEKAVKTLRGEA